MGGEGWGLCEQWRIVRDDRREGGCWWFWGGLCCDDDFSVMVFFFPSLCCEGEGGRWIVVCWAKD